MNQISYKARFVLGSLLIAIIPCTFLLLYYLNSMQDFYREKIQIYQENELTVMQAKLQDIARRTTEIADEIIGTIIVSDTFVHYSESSLQDKLFISRDMKNQLSNKAITNKYINNIYVMSFEGELYSSNGDVNKQEFIKSMKRKIDINQSGVEILQSTHSASYYRNQNLISFQKYLNKYTPGNEIGLVQIDIGYNTIVDAVSMRNMTNTDFVIILDGEDNIVYAPDESWLEHNIREIQDNRYNYGKILDNLKLNNLYNDGNNTIRQMDIADFNWRIIQFNSDRMFKSTNRELRNTWFLISALCIFSAVTLAYILSISINRSIVQIIHYMLKASKGNFEINVESMGRNEFAQLVDAFNTMVEHIDRLLKENVEKEHERTTMELMALNSKINSHFLYNTLNLIKLLAIKNKQMDIAHIIVSLCGTLEYSYKNTDTLVPVEDEIEFIKNYMYIQIVRFNKKVLVKYEIEETAGAYKVPKMILQPIVENSFLHAFDEENKAESENLIEISVSVEEKEHRLRICVEDNGKGFQYQGLESLLGIGLKNVVQRLKIFYKDAFSYEIKSCISEGTKIVFYIPVSDDKKGNTLGDHKSNNCG
ncbi:MAG: histidine kinase [Lachnospiraceae bacterium]|nr:histidine kinase [Lachnospiraceae bacterium]